MSQESIIQENIRLKAENAFLQERLKDASYWMQRQIKEQTMSISRRKLSSSGYNLRESFLIENQSEIFAQRIEHYFGTFFLSNAPDKFLHHCITAEVAFYNLTKNPTVDWVSVIIAYQKAFDLLVEQSVTCHFRTFALQNKVSRKRNDPIEKSLQLVVQNNYILGLWRLYAILSLIRNNQPLESYVQAFADYLTQRKNLSEVLLSDTFFGSIKTIVESNVFSEKRHTWTVLFEEVKEARKYMIGDFTDKNAILYSLLKMDTVEI